MTIMPEAEVEEFMKRCPPADEDELDDEVEAVFLERVPKPSKR